MLRNTCNINCLVDNIVYVLKLENATNHDSVVRLTILLSESNKILWKNSKCGNKNMLI